MTCAYLWDVKGGDIIWQKRGTGKLARYEISIKNNIQLLEKKSGYRV